MKTYVVALTTFREIIRRPMFWGVAFVSAILLMLFALIPYFTLGEDIKMVKDQGLALMTVSGLLIALFAASVSIADEIDGKTAITLLSKPINRRQFILGKYYGIMAAILLLIVLLAIIFSGTLFYKVGFEAKENALEAPSMEDRLDAIQRITPGIVLAYLQVAVLCALSVAFSTRFPIHWNITLCITIYLLGNLAPQLVAFSRQHPDQPVIEFMAKIFRVILPGLGFFNIGAAISTDAEVPWVAYVLPCLLYSVLYSSFALVLAFLMFEDRDLA